MRNIYLILIGLTLFANADFTRDNNGIVTDTLNKLQWQDDIDPYDTRKQIDLQNAYIQCEDLTLGGYEDWRLPNINELASIIDDNKHMPALYSIFENQVNNENDHMIYWSSTTDGRTPGSQDVIRFESGQIFSSGIYKTGVYLYTRCVRSLN